MKSETIQVIAEYLAELLEEHYYSMGGEGEYYSPAENYYGEAEQIIDMVRGYDDN